MPYRTDKELIAELKQADAEALAPLYLLYGGESWFIRQAVARIVSRAADGPFSAMNLQRFSGDKLSWPELEDACAQLPMMAARRCVTVCDLDVDKLTKGDLDRLLALLAEPNDTTVLVLYMPGVSVDLKRSAKCRKLADAAARRGIVCEFPQKDRATLKRALCDRARRANVKLEMDVAETLVERVGQNYAVLTGELDKLLCYRDGGEITEADVEECCVRSVEASAFDLARSILSGNYSRAFRTLDELFYLRQEAISVLGALSMAFSDFYRAKCALAAGKTADQVAVDFGYPKNRLFAVRNAFRDVRSVSTARLDGCIAALTRADASLKSSRADDRLILEQMLGEIIQAGR